ncbi:MAG: dTDP-4-dehydrorhamnose reductase [Desulfovibrio sp.]
MISKGAFRLPFCLTRRYSTIIITSSAIPNAVRPGVSHAPLVKRFYMDTAPHTPRILILGGKTGLLGQAMANAAAIGGYDVVATGREDFNPTDTAKLAEFIDDTAPNIVCNTIAYTQVDNAETEEEEALLLNRVLPCSLGRIIKERPAIHLVHFSTDFVFNGRKETAYTEEDAPAPLNAYGRSKLAGEKALLDLHLEKCAIVRTAWLFGPGKKNFISTILNLCREGKHLNIIHDQLGSPTYTPDLAAYCLNLVEAGGTGIFHITNSGQASWCEVASEAVRFAQLECPIAPIPAKEYPQKAARPAFSVLSTAKFTQRTGITPRPWPQALAEYVYSTMSPI